MYGSPPRIRKPSSTFRALWNIPCPTYYASQVEYMSKNLKYREECRSLSLHPHNDRGCGVAMQRWECLQGQTVLKELCLETVERTGNVDIVTLAHEHVFPGCGSGDWISLTCRRSVRNMSKYHGHEGRHEKPLQQALWYLQPSPVPIRMRSPRV